MKEFKFIQECLDRAQEEILAHYMAKKEHPLWVSEYGSILKIKKEMD